MESSPSGPRLSPRQREVLLWFAKGKSADEVASILGISLATVMFHYREAARQLGTTNRTHTVALAIRKGLIELDGEPDAWNPNL